MERGSLKYAEAACQMHGTATTPQGTGDQSQNLDGRNGSIIPEDQARSNLKVSFHNVVPECRQASPDAAFPLPNAHFCLISIQPNSNGDWGHRLRGVEAGFVPCDVLQRRYLSRFRTFQSPTVKRQ